MSMNFELKIEQSQRLVMTPELHQAITLLQFSSLELVDYIQEEMTTNPLLEIQEKEEDDGNEANGKESEVISESLDKNEKTPFEWEDYFNDQESYYHRSTSGTDFREREPSSFEHYISGENTLHEHLNFQLLMSTEQEKKRTIAEYLIGNLDANGYLQGDVAEHAHYLGIKVKEVEDALVLVQSFDPAGVGARTLQECLLLQIKTRERVPALVETVIRDYLPGIARGNFREMAQQLEVSQKELQEAVDLIRGLNPKPGANLGGAGETRYIVPDVIVEKIESAYVVLINDNVPSLVISPFYRSLLQKQEEGLSSYIKKRLDSALWLIKSIEQRRQTLYRVTVEIMEIQNSFLEKGVRHLRPLTLKEIADRVGIHESTVSRATSNKYVQTPRGLYPLKFFFSSGIHGIAGESHSVLSIKSYLRELVENEDPAVPQSDQKLAELLKAQGMKVSRRTITKYREELGIPASFKRRRV